MTKLIFSLLALALAINSISSSEVKIATTVEEKEMPHAAMYGGGNFGGDMMLNKRQRAGMKSRNAWPNFAVRWPGGIIPYVVDNGIGNLRNMVDQAAAHIKNQTGGCIQFVPRTNQNDYVRMIYGNKGCWSWIGKQGGPQELHLGNGCGFFGLVVHEMLHAVGFAHEQNRPDRDNYLTIFPQNIQQGQGYNFDKVNNGIVYNDFDYNSIMLYGEYAFTAYKGYKTMEDKTKRYTIREPYEKNGMTPSDSYEVKQYYQCR